MSRRKPAVRMWIDPVRYAWERCHCIPLPEILDNFVFDVSARTRTRNYL